MKEWDLLEVNVLATDCTDEHRYLGYKSI